VNYLGKISVIEYKSPDDYFGKGDFDTLRIYALLSKKKYGIERDEDIGIFSLASHFEPGYYDYVTAMGYDGAVSEAGVWSSASQKMRYHAIDLVKVGTEHPHHPINILSAHYRNFAFSSSLSGSYLDLILYIGQMIYHGGFTMKNQELVGFSEVKKSIEEIREQFLASFSVAERLKGLKPEEVFNRFRPEERLKGLKPEEILERFRPEERLKGLKPEEIARSLRAMKKLSKEDKENLRRILELDEEE
jgi:hypothetical protein